MDNTTIEMEVDDQLEEGEWSQCEDDNVTKQERDRGPTSVMNEDGLGEAQLSSGSNLGPESNESLQNLTSPVKIKAKVEEKTEAETQPLYEDISSGSHGGSESEDEETQTPPDCSRGEDEPPPECSWNCIHAKQNELLKEAVHQLSVRNTLLEDFIKAEFGEKFQTFVRNRQLLLNMGFGETGKQTSGERSLESDEIVDLFRFIKESVNAKAEQGHQDLKKTETAPVSASKTENISMPASSTSVIKVAEETLNSDKPSAENSNLQNKISVANEIANPLTDGSLKIADVPPTVVATTFTPLTPSVSTLKRIVAKRRLSEPSIEDESSDEEEEINGLNLYQVLKWQELQKHRTLAICPVCRETLKMKNMRDHLMIIHKGIKLNCVFETCGMEFKTRRLFQKHLIKNHFWTEDVYLKTMNSLEEPVCEWLNEKCFELVPTTMETLIRRKRLEAYMENARNAVKKRLASILSPSKATSTPALIPPAQIRSVNEATASNKIKNSPSIPALKPSSKDARPPKPLPTPPPPPKISTQPDSPMNESSDEDEDLHGVTLGQLMKWEDAGKSRKLAVCQLCVQPIKVKHLRDHYLIIHKGIRLSCVVAGCRKDFKTRSLLKKHLSNKHLWTTNVEEVYSERIKSLEWPVLAWLDRQSTKYNATTIPNAIRKKMRQLEERKEREEAKKKKSSRKKVLAPPSSPVSSPTPPTSSTRQKKPKALPRTNQESLHQPATSKKSVSAKSPPL